MQVSGNGERFAFADAVDHLVQYRVNVLMLADVGSAPGLGQADINMAAVVLCPLADDKALLLQRGKHLVHLAFEHVGQGDQTCGSLGLLLVSMTQQNAQNMALVKAHGGDNARIP